MSNHQKTCNIGIKFLHEPMFFIKIGQFKEKFSKKHIEYDFAKKKPKLLKYFQLLIKKIKKNIKTSIDF